MRRGGHDVVGLARTRHSENQLAHVGVTPLRGDLRDIDGWIPKVAGMDGVIHAAATWTDDMAAIDRQVVEALIPVLASRNPPMAFIYTGGTWRYGATGSTIASEESPRLDIPYFADSLNTEAMVLSAPRVRGMVIHPAMVYEDHGGVLEHMYDDARNLGYVRVIGGESVRWPLVHHEDLGDLYVLMLERGRAGDVFNGSAIEGCSIGKIARAIAERMGLPTEPVIRSISDAVREYGPWAAGYAIDHQVSGRKAMETLGWRPRHRDVIADIADH